MSATPTTPLTTTYSVQGMTCGHCASAVSDEVSALEGVRSVEVDLVAGGVSTVRVVSDAPLSSDAVAAALDEAGDYTLVGS
jgi:copper chaperone CopZ